MFLLIRTGFSGERCSPWASCSDYSKYDQLLIIFKLPSIPIISSTTVNPTRTCFRYIKNEFFKIHWLETKKPENNPKTSELLDNGKYWQDSLPRHKPRPKCTSTKSLANRRTVTLTKVSCPSCILMREREREREREYN